MPRNSTSALLGKSSTMRKYFHIAGSIVHQENSFLHCQANLALRSSSPALAEEARTKNVILRFVGTISH